MVLHADLCWLEVSTRDLWPLELNYDTYLHNYTPRKETGIPPDEKCSGAVSNYEKPRVAQTWGCTAYFLDPRIKKK